MGLFNTLYVKCVCPACENETNMPVQFKFGNCRLHEYKLGDKLLWLGNANDVGSSYAGRLKVNSVAICPECGNFIDADVYIDKDIISHVTINGRDDKGSNTGRIEIIID